MAVYTVHQPPAKRPASRRGAERFAFVRDGFYFWAFLFGPLWMLAHRLWLATLGYVVLTAALMVGLRLLGADAGFWVHFLLSVLVGLEAGTLWRWTLRRNGWRDVGLVAGDSLEAAEQRFFSTWADDEPAALPILRDRPPQTSAWNQQPATDIVGGMFPGPGAGR